MTATATRRAIRCTRTPLRHTPPTEPQLLRRDIADICHQIDRRLNNKPGTAERGTYFWYWPPEDIHSLDVLAALHCDAVRLLAELAANPIGDR